MITVYGIKNCDSVKKALKFLNEHKIDYSFVDFKQTPQNTENIKNWCGIVSVDLLFNKRGTTYRTLSLKDRTLERDDKIALMAEHNMLIKRPVIEYNDQLIVGFDLTDYQGVFLK